MFLKIELSTDGVVVAEEAAKADCTITISDADLLSLSTGKLNAMSAYMSAKLKLKGKSSLAQKCTALTALEPTLTDRHLRLSPFSMPASQWASC